jgi:alkylated DNA repair protein (DNA oxidative demethylase)
MPANKGFHLLKSKLIKAIQQDILAAARAVVKQAPLFRPSMPSGQSFNYSKKKKQKQPQVVQYKNRKNV